MGLNFEPGVPLKDYLDSELENVRRHVAEQVSQIHASLLSADKLEQERLARASDGLRALKTQITIAAKASKEAINKAESAQKDYNVRSNEFRGQLSDQAKTLIPRREVETLLTALSDRYEAVIKSVTDKVDANTLRIERTEGRGSGFTASGAIVMAILSLMATVGIGILVIVTR
jgi:hypothetical protein